MRYYYYPLCSKDFTFENIFSSESISPISFYSKRGFGIDYFYKIPKIHNEEAIILYNEPPKYEITNTNTDAVKFILQIAEVSIDMNEVIVVNEGIIAYQKTIYLNRNNFNILFFSEKDKKITSLKSETSLPTKGLKKFKSIFKVISEKECKEFDLSNIELLKLGKDGLKDEILFDRKYNYFKGLIYGITTGIISAKSKEITKVKKSFQEITNCFAELKNRYRNNLKGTEGKYQKDGDYAQASLEIYEKRLKEAIGASEKFFSELFPTQTFSEDKLVKFLSEKHSTRLGSFEEAERYINHLILDDEIIGSNNFTKLKNYYLKKSSESIPGAYFDTLLKQTDFYSGNAKYSAGRSRENKEDSNEVFKGALYELNRFVEKEFINNTSNKKVDLTAIHFDFLKQEIAIDPSFQTLPKNEIEEFTLISNSILTNPKFSRGEARKEQILAIVEQAGRTISKKQAGKETQLYQYLNNQINEYSIDKVSSLVMKNFVAFIFNPDSLEKLENYIDAKEIKEKWMAYSFWCAFNGFANISRNFVKPIFDTENEELQDYIDTYLQANFSTVAITSNALSNLDISEIPLSNDNSFQPKNQKETLNKNREFYEKYIDGRYKISFENFSSIIQIDDEAQVLNELKNKGKIIKKEGKKLVASYKTFISSTILF